MIPFAGYQLPVHFPLGVLGEHKHTRNKTGLFDVSHMGQLLVKGKGAVKTLEKLVCSDIKNLREGQVKYTVLTNETGGIIDDLMISKINDAFFLVVNAACKTLYEPLLQLKMEGDVSIKSIKNNALIALQGPHAQTVLGRLSTRISDMGFMTIINVTIAETPCIISRTGYTGEDGYEISASHNSLEKIAKTILDEDEVEFCGLGARDSLRLEAGLCLYGKDIDRTTTPIEANLAWVIGDRRIKDKTFPGAQKIIQQMKDGPKKKRVGIIPMGRTIPREGTKITDAHNTVIGEVTSGGFGPSLNGPLAMGYVVSDFAKLGTQVGLIIRGKELKAKVVDLPFVPHKYFKRSKNED